MSDFAPGITPHPDMTPTPALPLPRESVGVLRKGEGGKDAAVVRAMRGFRQALLRREMKQMEEMARRWLELERALDGELAALAFEASQAGTSLRSLYRLERYERLLRQVQEEMEAYIRYAAELVRSGQYEMAERGVLEAAEAIRLSGGGPAVAVDFHRLPVRAVENMVGLAGDGKPVGELLRRRMRVVPAPRERRGASQGEGFEMWQRLTRTLIDGTARGWSPVRTARAMRDDLAEGLQKAMVIARTEQLRVYREASRAQYEASEVVKGHARVCAHDGRVCAACLADEGTIFPVEEAVSDHPQGRCTSVPVLKDGPAIDWLKGEDWLRTQDEATQRSILGEKRFEKWKNKELELREMMQETYHPVWGRGLRVRKLEKEGGAAGEGLLKRLSTLEGKDVLSVGKLNEEIVEAWGGAAGVPDLEVVITGERRQHYLENHPDVKSVEGEIFNVLLDPDLVCKNRKDMEILIFYRNYDAKSFLRAAVLMQKERGHMKHSVMSYRFARNKEVESDRVERFLWEKK